MVGRSQGRAARPKPVNVDRRHVRSGSEKGREWFEAARQLKKKTSFSDFISCAEMLTATRHTRAKRIALHGFSGGGLLVGVANNMRPDLWSAVIGQAPFVDMLNTMSDATHPLVPLTRPVWGDPLTSPAAYDYIASCSPKENVETRPQPAVLASTTIGDDRVGFWEPAKWIAILRRHSTSSKPMLLHTETSGRHQGASGRFDEYSQIARMYAFAIWQTEQKATGLSSEVSPFRRASRSLGRTSAVVGRQRHESLAAALRTGRRTL